MSMTPSDSDLNPQTPSASAVISATPPSDEREPVVTRVLDTILGRHFGGGYDFFISYAWKDGRTYAVKLCEELKLRGLRCFLDSEELSKGSILKPEVRRALKRSNRLLLVVTKGAMNSDNVKNEIDIFHRMGRPVWPINIANLWVSVTAAEFREKIGAGILRFEVPGTAEVILNDGPSRVLLDDIEKSFQLRRQSEIRAFWLGMTGIVFLLLSIGLCVIRWRAQGERDDARREKAKSDWQLAVEARGANRLLKAAHLFLRGAQALSEIESITGEDANLVRSHGLAAHAVDQAVIRTWFHETSLDGAMFDRDGSQFLTWNGKKGQQRGKAASWNLTLWDVSDPNPKRTFEHRHHIIGATFNRDGSRVLTWSGDSATATGEARLWDITQRAKQPLTFQHNGAVNGAQFNEDESRVLTWSDDETAKLWDVNNPQEPLTIFKHKYRLISAVLSRDESRVLTLSKQSGSRVGEARLWDATRADQPLQIFNDGGTVRGVEFSSDESRVLTWSDDKGANLWDVNDSEHPLKIFDHGSPVHGAHLNKDASLLLTWGGDYDNPNGEVRLWDVTKNDQPLKIFKHDGFVKYAEFSSEDSHVFSWSGNLASEKGSAWWWDATEDDQPLRTFKHDDNSLKGAKFSPHTRRALTWSWDTKNPKVQLWDVTKPNPIATFQHNNFVFGAELSSDTSHVLTWSSDNAVRLWNTGEPESRPSCRFLMESVCSRDEKHLLTWGLTEESKVATLYDTSFPKAHREASKEFALQYPVLGAQFSHDESRVLIWSFDYSTDKGETRLWDVNTPETSQNTFEHDYPVIGAEFSRDGARLLTWSGGSPDGKGEAKIWDITKSKPVPLTFNCDNAVYGAKLSADESHVLTWGGSLSGHLGNAQLWDLTDPKGQPKTFKHDEPVFGAQFSNSSSRVLTWSHDGTARLWNVSTPESAFRTFPHNGHVNGARFSRNESRVLTWSSDMTAHLWDVTSSDLKTLATFNHDDEVLGALFNQDESRVLTWSLDKTVKLWDTTKPDPLVTFRHHTGVFSAQFSADESRVLTWAIENDEILKRNKVFATDKVWLWNCSDPLSSLSPAARILELKARSGTTLDERYNLRTLKFDEWQRMVGSKVNAAH